MGSRLISHFNTEWDPNFSSQLLEANEVVVRDVYISTCSAPLELVSARPVLTSVINNFHFNSSDAKEVSLRLLALAQDAWVRAGPLPIMHTTSKKNKTVWC